MKIGDAIQALTRSELESERFLESIREGRGRPFEVYTTHAINIKEIDIWKFALRRMKISGFRPGKGNSLVVDRVRDGVCNNDPVSKNVFLELYANSVVYWLQKEHPNLNRLLLEREIEGSSNSTDNIVKEILKYAALYEVESEQIEELYELWWFERTENLSDLFSNQELSFPIVKEIISKSAKKQTDKIDDVSKKVDSLELEIEKRNNYLELEEELKTLRGAFVDLRNDFDLEVARFQKNQFESVGDRLRGIEEKLDKKKNEGSLETEAHIKRRVGANAEKINSLDRKIDDLLEEKKKKGKSKKRKETVFNSSKSIKINVSRLIEGHNLDESHADLLRLVLNSFGCFYVHSDFFFRAIAQEILQDGGAKEIISVPSMVDVSQELSIELEGYDLIYLKNIASCFVDGFAIPLLTKSGSQIDVNSPKIFVLHDDELNSTYLPKIKKHTVEISADWLMLLRDIEVLSPVEGSNSSEIEEISENHKEFRMIFRNSGIEVDQQVFETFVRLSHILKPFVGEEQSIHLSAEATVFEYVRCQYGEMKSQVPIDLIQQNLFSA